MHTHLHRVGLCYQKQIAGTMVAYIISGGEISWRSLGGGAGDLEGRWAGDLEEEWLEI